MNIYSPQNLPPDLVFYVYAYLRQDGSPYYIGKGKGNRAWKKHRGHNPPKDKSRIIIWESNLTEAEAFALEKTLIWWFGRKDNKTGILKNLTDGGEGPSGHIHTPETRAKMSKAQTGKTPSPETKAKISAAMTGKMTGEKHHMYGKTPSPETKAKLSAANTGQKKSPETKAKLSEAKTGEKHHMYGRTTYELTNPEGNTYIVGGGFTKWCKDMNLNPGNMIQVALEKAKHHKGWTARIL